MSLLSRLDKRGDAAPGEPAKPPESKPRDADGSGRLANLAPRRVDPYERLKRTVHDRLVDEIDTKLLEAAEAGEAERELDEKVGAVIAAVAEESEVHLTRQDFRKLQEEIVDEVIGYGPINPLMNDPDVSEVMVNGPNQVYVERRGKIVLSDVRFRDNRHVQQVIEKIVSPLGRRIDESSPMVDARLPDGSRVNAIIPPLALNGPTLTIRRFSKDPFTVDDLVNFGSLTREMAQFLDACVKVRLNIVVSGGTGSGKCMTHDTPVMLGDGAVRNIGAVVEEQFERTRVRADSEGWEYAPGVGTVMSFDPTLGTIGPRRIEGYWRHRAPKRLVKVRLASGASVQVTPEHPFFSLKDAQLTMVRADQLCLGTPVAVPTHLSVEGRSLDLISKIRRSESLYVSGRADLVRRAIDEIRARESFSSIPAVAQMLGIPWTTLRAWTTGNAVPCHRFFDLLERAGMSVDDVGQELSVKVKTSSDSITLPRWSTPDIWRMTGMVMGDGHVTRRYVEFFNQSPQLHEVFAELAGTLGVRARVEPQADRTTRSRATSAAFAVVLHEVFGIPYGNKSGTLRLPPEAIALPDDEVAALLAGLFDTDGTVSRPASPPAIAFNSKSDGLVGDVSYLFVRLGLRGRIRRRSRDTSLTLYGQRRIRRFHERVCLLHPMKRARLEFAASKDVTENTNVDTFPEMGGVLGAVRRDMGLSQREWAEKLGVSRRLIGMYERGERRPSRAVMSRLADVVPESPMAAAASGFASWPVQWDEVAGLEMVDEHGEDFVYDLTVEGTHTFIAGYGGIIVHNTTLLNVLSSFIPSDERIVTIEDAAELQLRQEHVVSLESRPPNVEGRGAITIRDLVRNSLRMRPDRVVVGECRGGEALDMLQAMNTGHDGSLTTGHANSPRDMLSRLETMVLMSGMDLPVRAIREQIASAVDLIVQQSRLRDGSRKVTRITEIQGMEGDVITMQDIFAFVQTGIDENGNVLGSLKPTGIRPKFADRFEAEGIRIPPDLFMEV